MLLGGLGGPHLFLDETVPDSVSVSLQAFCGGEQTKLRAERLFVHCTQEILAFLVSVRSSFPYINKGVRIGLTKI